MEPLRHPSIILIFCGLLWYAGSLGIPVASAESEDGESRRLRAVWKRHWNDFASRYAKVGDDYFSLVRYDPKYPSSSRTNAQQFQEKYTTTIKFCAHRTNYVMREMPSAVDAKIAAMVIPRLQIGEYGFIHSCVVERVLGPDDLIVREVWFVDQNQVRRDRQDELRNLQKAYQRNWEARREAIAIRFLVRDRLVQNQRESWRVKLRLRGYDTADIVSGTRWTGPTGKGLQISLVDTDKDPHREGQQLFVAIAIARFKRGLNEDEFKALVLERGFTIERFAQLVQTERRKNRRKAVARVIMVLERRFPQGGNQLTF